MRRLFAVFMWLFITIVVANFAHADGPREATLYKDPLCTCCAAYGRYLEANGFKVTVIDSVEEIDALHARYKVPAHLEGCHSTVIEGYLVEGHVPVAAINRLLEEKPPLPGISLPGMPDGSPGMSGYKQGAFPIFVISDDAKPPLYSIE
ncbi:MAG: hypothetical protein EXQ98_03805 [Alphaproteobacteria bacterium]|nr:hypothetical protein [Alphaproteobacteria bacterium]